MSRTEEPICSVCSRNGITALVARPGGLGTVLCTVEASLSIILALLFDSKRLLLLPCTCPLERILLWAVQLLICFLLARFWDCSVSNHRLVFLWQNKTQKIEGFLHIRFPDSFCTHYSVLNNSMFLRSASNPAGSLGKTRELEKVTSTFWSGVVLPWLETTYFPVKFEIFNFFFPSDFSS